jgi:hypothetical protein
MIRDKISLTHGVVQIIKITWTYEGVPKVSGLSR